MTRQTRTLLVMALLAVAAVVALAMMARRYASMLDGRRGGNPAVAEAPAPSPMPVAGAAERVEAERLVTSWLRVRRALAGPKDVPGLEAALVAAGLSRAEFERLEAIHREWRAGRGDGRALYAAMDRRRDAIEALPPLGDP